MDSINHQPIPTVDNVLLLIADMLSKEYSNNYISRLINSQRYHKNMATNPNEVLSHPKLKIALSNIYKRPIPDDTRLPLTPEAIISMSSVADRDFSLKNAIMVKAALWLAFTCMLRWGEYSYSGQCSTPLKTEHITITRHSVTLHFSEGWKWKNRHTTLKYPYVAGTHSRAYSLLCNYHKLRASMSFTSTDIFFVTDEGRPLDQYVWTPLFNHMVDHSDWYDLNLTTHSLRIGGATLCHHNGEEKLEIHCLGHWTDDTIFKYFRTNLLLDPSELRKIPAYKRVRQEVLHFFCSCKVDPTDPGGDARISRQVSPFHHTDTSFLNDTTKILTYQKCRTGHLHYAQRYAYITPHLCSTDAFVKSKLEAMPYVSTNVIDWNYITEHFAGDKLWFSLSVWIAKCRWKCWNQEGRYLSNNTHNPTYLQNAIHPPEILVNTKLVTKHDSNKAKALLITYRQFLTEITPAQRRVWDQIVPKKGKKNAYVPNSVWASAEQLEWQQRYAQHGDSSEPIETSLNVQSKYPGGKAQPAVYCTNNLLSRLPLGTSSLGPALVCRDSHQHPEHHQGYQAAYTLQTGSHKDSN